jgi:hypothetical protein
VDSHTTGPRSEQLPMNILLLWRCLLLISCCALFLWAVLLWLIWIFGRDEMFRYVLSPGPTGASAALTRAVPQATVGTSLEVRSLVLDVPLLKSCRAAGVS